MRFELFIATRYLRAKRRQAFIGIITGISIVGVAAGVASLVVAMAITNGFRQDLQQRLLGSTSHISLQRVADDGIQNWPALMDRLSKEPHVVAAAPAIFEQVLISRGPRARGAVLKGHDPEIRTQSRRPPQLREGGSAAPLEEESKPDALTTIAARQIPQPNLPTPSKVSSSVSPPCLPSFSARTWPTTSARPSARPCYVTSPQGELTPFGMVPKYNRFHVVGIFNSGFFDYDSNWAFARLSDCAETIRPGRPDFRAGVQDRRSRSRPTNRAPSSKTPPARDSWPPTTSSRTARSSTPSA